MRADHPPGRSPLTRAPLWQWLGIAAGPLLLTVVVLTVFYRTVGLSPVPRTPTGVYAAASVGVVLLVVWWLPAPARSAVIPYRRPSRAEVAAAIAVTAATILVFDPIAAATGAALGAEDPSVGSFGSPLGAVVFGVSSLVVAPFAEEILFRGLALEALYVRYGAAVALVGSSLVFGGIHVVIGGLSGVVFSFLSGLVYAGMRLRYDNMTGVTLAHALNNAYWVGVMLGALPNVVPVVV